jgi:segregation and condensation protein B
MECETMSIGMGIAEMENAVEAILFAAGGEVRLKDMAAALEQDEKTTRAVVENLIDKYDSQKRGIAVIRVENAYQMCTRDEYYDYIKKLFQSPVKRTLSQPMLETLAIIAYKQPVTRAAIEEIRGVSAERAVNKLMEFGLVEEKGRLNVPGRPILFGITDEFLKYFGYDSVAGMPEKPEPSEQLRLEALNEIDGINKK